MNFLSEGLTQESISMLITLAFFMILFFSFLGGFFKGLRKSLFCTIFYVLYFVIILIILRPVAIQLLNTRFGFAPFNGNNAYDLVKTYLIDNNMLSPEEAGALFAKDTTFFTTISEMMIAVAKLVALIAFIIIYFTLYKLLVSLIWLIFGRPYLKLRKKVDGEVITKKKHVWLGGLIGLIPGLISVFIIFTPIDLAINASRIILNENLNYALSGDGENPINDQLLEELIKYTTAYNKSVVGQIYSNIKIGDKNLSLATFDALLTLKNDEKKYHFVSSIHYFIEAAEGLLDTDIYDLFKADKIEYSEIGKYSTEGNRKAVNAGFVNISKADIINMIIDAGVDYLQITSSLDDTQPAAKRGALMVGMNDIDYNVIKGINWCKDIASLGTILEETLAYFSNITSLDDLMNNFANNPTGFKKITSELFDLQMVNAAIDIGAGFLLQDDKVKEIVKDVQFTSDEIVADLNSLVDVIIELSNFGIGFSKWSAPETNIVSVVGSNAGHLENIFEIIFDLNIFKKVDKQLVTYLMENYVDTNPEIAAYITSADVLACYDDSETSGIRNEVLNIISMFKKLSEETDLLNSIQRVKVENVDIPPEDNNEWEYVFEIKKGTLNLKICSIISDAIEGSRLIPKMLNGAFKNVVVNGENALLTEDAFNNIVNDPAFSWKNELLFLGAVSEEIDFIPLIAGEDLEYSLNLFRALAKKNSNNEFYINKVRLIKEILIVNIEGDGSSDVSLITDLFASFNIGLEITKLCNIIEAAGIADENGIIKLDNIEEQFKQKLTTDLLRTFASEIKDSEYLPNLLKKTVGDELIDYADTGNWTNNQWEKELITLANVLEDGGIVGSDHLIDIENISDNFSSLSTTLLNAIADNVGGSDLLKGVLRVELKSVVGEDFKYENKDGTPWSDDKWKQEIIALSACVDSILDDDETKIKADDLIDTTKIKIKFLNTLTAQIANSMILQKTLEDNLQDLVNPKENDQYKDTYIDMGAWSNVKWETEVGSLNAIAITIADFNEKDYIDVSSPDNVLPKDLIPFATIEAAHDNYYSTIIQRQFKGSINDIAENDNFVATYMTTDEDWERELATLVNIGKILKYKPTGYQLDAIDSKINLGKVKKALLIQIKTEVKTSYLTRQMMKKPINDITEAGFTDTWNLQDKERWVGEVSTLVNIAITFADANDEIDLDNLTFDELAIESVGAIRDNVNCYLNENGDYYQDPSLIVVRLSNEHFVKLMNTDMTDDSRKVTEVDLNNWNGLKWKTEYTAVYNFVDTLEKNQNNKITFNNIKMDEFNMKSIAAIRDNVENSTALQKASRANLEKTMNKTAADMTLATISTETWVGSRWKTEYTAIYDITRTKAKDVNGDYNPTLADEELTINIKDFDADSCLEETLVALENNVEDSIFARVQLRIPFAKILDVKNDNFMDVWLDDLGTWNFETHSIFNLVRTMDKVNNEIVLDNLNYDEINVSTIYAASQNESKLVIAMFLQSIPESTNWAPSPSHHWSDEVYALYNVSDSIKNTQGKVEVKNIDFTTTISIDTIRALGDVIHNSTYLQTKIYPSMFKSGENVLLGAPAIGYQNNDRNQWQDEIRAIYNIFNGSSFVDSDGKINLNTVQNNLQANVEIELSLMEKIGDNINNSTYMQTKLRPTLLELTITKDAGNNSVDQLARGDVQTEYGVTRSTILNIGYQVSVWHDEIWSLTELQYALIPGATTVIVNDVIQAMKDFRTTLLVSLVDIFTDYQDAILIKILLNPTLERIVGESGITMKNYVAPVGYSEFRWIDDDQGKISDLTYFYSVLSILNIDSTNNITAQNLTVALLGLGNDDRIIIDNAKTESLYVNRLLFNYGL